jgi:alkanesulfonate monooxygenase SsuD/methylene tetrahydromethanopterin reductase-like flavin-dependent oxidoreductase (luciferase family)
MMVGTADPAQHKGARVNFLWFHLMPYRALPADFSERYESVWVNPPSELFDPATMHELYNTSLDELEFADQMGYDAICVNEHHQNAYGLMPSPNLMAAALARRASKAALCVLGDSIALYNPPIRVAEEFAMLDCLSGGRLICGFPVGTSMDTNYCYGQTPAQLREKYYEAHDLIVQAWTRPEVFDFNGKYTQLRYVNIWPRPLQQPHPPIWIPGGGSIETWAWTTKLNYVYCYLSYNGHKHAANILKGYWDEVERLGGDDNPYRAGFAQIVAVAETDEQAEQMYRPHAEFFFNNCLHVATRFAEAPGYRTLPSLQAGLRSQFGRRMSQQRAKLTWTDLVRDGYVIAGSPATVREQLEQAVTNLRVGQLMLLMQFGDMPKEKTFANTELFAREVMPHLKNLWSGYEDHWWPKPMTNPVEPAPITVGAK